jgi:hypothetical protein
LLSSELLLIPGQTYLGIIPVEFCNYSYKQKKNHQHKDVSLKEPESSYDVQNVKKTRYFVEDAISLHDGTPFVKVIAFDLLLTVQNRKFFVENETCLEDRQKNDT